MIWDRLTPRERQVAELLLQAHNNQEIATRLKITRYTVKKHFVQIFRKLQITTGCKRVKLAVLVYRSFRRALKAKRTAA